MDSLKNTTEFKKEIKIIFEDSDILIINKPVGILSEDSQKGKKGIIHHLESNGYDNLHLLHRLDRNVGGVMILAKNKKSAAIISKEITDGFFKKSYLAVVDGVPVPESGIYRDLLFKDSRKNRSYVVSRMRKGVREASLEYRVISEKSEKSLVKVGLHTGRTHQIRVQFSHRKTPLTGDVHYGSKDKSCDIALYSSEIHFIHPSTKEPLCFKSVPDLNSYPWSIFGGDLNE